MDEPIQCESVAIEIPCSENVAIHSMQDDSGKENHEKSIEIENIEDNSKRNPIGLKTLSELNGKDNFIIDLDSGVIKPKTLTGPELLFQKYLKTQAKPKHKETVCMNILSVDNGKLENQKVEVRLDKEVELDHSRPGFSHEKLKENLKNQILQQRLEKLKQRLIKSDKAELEPEDKDYFPHNKEADILNENKKQDNNAEPDTSDEEWTEEVDENDTDESEEEIVTQKKKNNSSKFIDDQAVDDEDNELESSSETESSEDEEISKVQKKGRILKAFEDSDDEDSIPKNAVQSDSKIAGNNESEDYSKLIDSNLPKTSNILKCSEDLFSSQATDFTFNEPSISEEIIDNDLGALFDKPSETNNVEDDLMDLCSGQFSATPSQMILTNNDFKFTQNNQASDSQDDFISQVPEKNEDNPTINDSFILEVPEKNEDNPTINDSFVFDVPENTEPASTKLTNDVEKFEANRKSKEDLANEDEIHPIKNINKLLESTDDETEENEAEKKKIKRKKKKRDKTKKLEFSDDESDTEEQNVINTEHESLDEEEETEILEENPEIFVDYDSEENEVEVKLSKKEREKEAQGYFENEAELSESDWNSADEDEKGLDKYDSDLADEDEFDQAKLREEVGRIHARKLMDQDIKDVKKIQELLFEDEENDGIGRERKFKWKNQTDGFSLIDENARDADEVENAEQEEENEIMWRRMRHERETLINEQSQNKLGENENSILLLDQNSQTVTTANTSTLVKRKFQIIKTNSMPVELLNSSNENKLDSPFLIKSATTKKFTHSSFLSRDQQTLTKIASFICTKTDDEVTNLSSHGGNSMSFAPIEKKEDGKKRKSDCQESNSSGKKRKVENQRFLLDQLK